MELERDQFEEVAMAHFVAQRAAGVQISGDNGCEPTRESLFWRDDKGDYGVRMFNAAWWGWKEAAIATRKTCEVPSLDEAAMARLAEIERQEPVAEMTLVDMGIGDARQLRVNWLMDGYLDVGAKLYASAGASPVEPSLARAVEPFEVDWPEYHQRAMGCGLEDRGIRDRYEAMQYGWDQAIERVAERLPETLYATPQAAAQPPAPSEAAREYMTGYSDGREWAKPSQALVVEPVYQYQLANGNWIDQTKESYDYNVKHGQATVRMLYATPQPKAAPQPKETK